MFDNRPILPNWGVQYEWLKSIGFWDAWLALPVDYVRREHITEGEEKCLRNEERAKLEVFRDLQKRMETMERPWDKELGIEEGGDGQRRHSRHFF
jgi:hypothetical protein